MKKLLILILSALTLSSCSFLSPFNAQSYKYFVELKVLHIQFLKTFTISDNKIYDRREIDEFYNAVDIKFSEALEYEAHSSNDHNRLIALNILREELTENYKALVEDRKLFDKPYSQKTIEIVSGNYDLAIKGELARK